MARVYVKKADPFTAKITVPMTETTLKRLREYADRTGRTPTAAARDLIAFSIPEPAK